MTSIDFFFVMQWWVTMFFLGLIFLPLTSLLFKSFFDKGYAFSKILGLLLISYFVWLIASLKIFPFNPLLIYGVIFLFFIINLIILIKQNLFLDFKKHWKIFLFEEFIFSIGLLFWGYIKAHEPSIHGLEKFMDFGFINSILRSEYFPPKDIWLANSTINYYYFGHFVSALLIKLSSIPANIGYNLTLASIFGLCFSASFSIGANLYSLFLSPKLQATSNKLLVINGLISAFLVTLGGNLHTIYIFFQNYKPENPVPFWNLSMMLNLDGYWYPNATRFIPFTIHEFPSYSFVVSDLHGHVLDIPFVLLLIALLSVVFFQQKLNSYFLILISLLVAVFLMTNFLDAPIYLLVIFAVLIVKKLTSSQISLISLKTPITQISLILFGAVIFSLPFWFAFKPFGSGIGVICAPQFLVNAGHLGPFLFEADHCTRSPFWMLLILWGFPLFILISFIFSVLKLEIRNWKLIRNLKLEIRNSTDILALTLSLAAFILILIPEFFYVKDIYPAHWRANTVFKFGYQAFIILGLTSGYLLVRIIASQKRIIWLLAISSLLFALVAIYPYFAINSYFSNLRNYQRLNGLKWLEDSYPSDYNAINWINQNITGQPVILEAQGDSYTDFARVSANTGLPTVIGWPVHEWLWRGSYDESGKRIAEVTDLYESLDINHTKQLIQKYNIKYVFIGTLEKQKYTRLNEEKFQILGKIIFENGTSKIYQLN